MKKVVFGHLRALLWGFACIFIAQNFMTTPLFSPVRPPNQLTWRKQKLVFNYQTSGNFSCLSCFFGNFRDPPIVFKNSITLGQI